MTSLKIGLLTLLLSACFLTNAFSQADSPWRAPGYFLGNIPKAVEKPEMDGAIDPEEWRDALQWGVFFSIDMGVIAPSLLDTRLWMKWDEENLYVAMRGKLHPEEGTVRGTERVRQNSKGIRNADHMMFELYPTRDRSAGAVERQGSYSWLWNPLDTFSDYHLNVQPGQKGESWVSSVLIVSSSGPGFWESELQIPLTTLQGPNTMDAVEVPPQAGNSWSFLAGRRFGPGGDIMSVFSAPARPVFLRAQEDWASAWKSLPTVRLTTEAPVLHLNSLGNFAQGRIKPDWAIFNPGTESAKIQFELVVKDQDNHEKFRFSESIVAEPGVVTPGPVLDHILDIPAQKLTNEDLVPAELYLRIRDEAGTHLFIGPPLPFMVFEQSLIEQLTRGLETLRMGSEKERP